MSEPVLAIDEYGRPFIILKDQSTKTRLHGSEAIKVGAKTKLGTMLSFKGITESRID